VAIRPMRIGWCWRDDAMVGSSVGKDHVRWWEQWCVNNVVEPMSWKKHWIPIEQWVLWGILKSASC